MLCSVHISAPTNRLPATLVRSELPVLSSMLISFSLAYMWVPPVITQIYSLLFFFRFPPPPAGEAKGWINSLEEPRLISNIIQPRLQSVLCYSIDRKIKDARPVATIEHI